MDLPTIAFLAWFLFMVTKILLCESLLKHAFYILFSRGSAVGIATGYWLDDRGFGVRVPDGNEISLLHTVQTGSWAHPASYQMGIGALSPGVKGEGREADHSHPTSAEAKKTHICTSTPTYVFMAQRSVQHKDVVMLWLEVNIAS
jgi:hypothetical protein